MAYWAEIDSKNKVVRVTVGSNDEPDEGYQWLIDNLGGTWIKTSYNTRGGIHYGEDGAPDNGTPLNYNFGEVGSTWDGIGFYAPQPYPSWTLDKTTYLWVAPIPMPTDGDRYVWNEDTQSWDVIG
jgi:hypothetical protein